MTTSKDEQNTDRSSGKAPTGNSLGAGVPAATEASIPPGLGLFLQLTFVVVAALGVYLFVRAARDGETRRVCAPLCSISPDYAAQNRRAPDFELPAVGGGRVRLSQYRGKVVVLNFWTKSCKPCLEEMPSLNEFGKVVRNQEGIVLLTVNTDSSLEDANATLQSILGNDVAFRTLNDAESDVVRGKFGTTLYPETWVIDAEGIIRARIDGPRDWLSLAPLMLQLTNSLASPISCAVEFNKRTPTGTVCNDIPSAG